MDLRMGQGAPNKFQERLSGASGVQEQLLAAPGLCGAAQDLGGGAYSAPPSPVAGGEVAG